MPKSKPWKASYDSGRKYNPSWEKTYHWLRKKDTKAGADAAFCTICKAEISCKLSHIKRHEQGGQHTARAPAKNQAVLQGEVKKASSSTSVEPVESVKTADIELAAAIACHCSIGSIDHLGEVISKHAVGSPIGAHRMHRTKCSAIIRYCIAPSLKEELIRDLKDKRFVVVIDESTDVSSQKLLCIVVCYVSDTDGVMADFLGLITVVDTTAETLYDTLEAELTAYGLDVSKCIGFAADGANTMMGDNNSVWTRIKAKAVNCVMLKCICHSLALAIQWAFNELPSVLGHLLKEIPSWFKKSSLRTDQFMSLFNVMNADTGLESGTNVPTPFQKTSATRWLVRGKVMQKILENWFGLAAYFSVVEQSMQQQPDVRYKARLLREMLNDMPNYIVFQFATPLVQEFERVNSKFQATHGDPNELMHELDMHYRSLHSRLYKADGTVKSAEEVDYGFKFLTECQKYLDAAGASSNNPVRAVATQRIHEMKQRCKKMIEMAIVQVDKRLPETKNVFCGLSLLSPSTVLNQLQKPKFQDLPFLFLADQDGVEEQYRRIHLMDWSNEAVFRDSGIPRESIPFWEGVKKTTGFHALANYALNCLIIPSSNAVIERIFSLDTSTKTKPKNCMGVSCLDAIVRIKSHLQVRRKCCNTFSSTDTMLKKHKTSILYPTGAAAEQEEEEATNSLFSFM